MAGNKAAGEKMRQTMIERFGSEELWKEWLRSNGRKNKGKSKPGSGFASNPELAKVAGRIGGQTSRRKKQ